MLNPKLNSQEKNIIFNKGTEPPFSGKYDNFFEDGTYVCRRCQIPLYTSDSKFDAHCGWPSFDQEIKGRVKRLPDADGRRTEIQCATCGAHLGHVFLGEKMTPRDTRHCVNSLSLQFIPKSKMSGIETAVFGGGCFWCGEAIFRKLRGVGSVLSGYAGGEKANPAYEEVISGETGHAEVVKIEFDPDQISYETLLEVLFEMHDPTTLNRQGNDMGSQYRSVIFYTSDRQKTAALNFIKKLMAEKKFNQPIVTEIKPLTAFYPVEDYHFDYFNKNKNQPYCRVIISPKIKKIEEKFGRLI